MLDSVIVLFCCALLCVHSSFEINTMGKRELVALRCLSSWCLVIGEERAGCFALFVFLVSRDFCVALLHDATGWLQFVIVVFPGHTHLLF